MESVKEVLQDINLSIYSDDNLEVFLEKEGLEFQVEEVELEKIKVHFSFKTNLFVPLPEKSYVIKAVSSKYMYTLYNCICYIEENYIKGKATGLKYNVL